MGVILLAHGLPVRRQGVLLPDLRLDQGRLVQGMAAGRAVTIVG